MDAKVSKDTILEQIWWATAKSILEKLESGEASASDVANAMKLLKDNGISADAATGETEGEVTGPLKDILERLPQFTDQDAQ